MCGTVSTIMAGQMNKILKQLKQFTDGSGHTEKLFYESYKRNWFVS